MQKWVTRDEIFFPLPKRDFDRLPACNGTYSKNTPS